MAIIPPTARYFRTSMDGFFLEPGPEANRTPMSLYDAHCRMMRDHNPNYFRVQRQLPFRPLRYPWINLTTGAKAEAGQPAIKRRPQKKPSAVVVSVRILGEIVLMCLRPVLAFGTSLVKHLLASETTRVFVMLRRYLTGTEAESESVAASLTVAASPNI